MTTTPPLPSSSPPVGTEEVPDTDPAPVVVDVPRVPSLPWTEETPTAVERPHPHEHRSETTA